MKKQDTVIESAYNKSLDKNTPVSVIVSSVVPMIQEDKFLRVRLFVDKVSPFESFVKVMDSLKRLGLNKVEIIHIQIGRAHV